MSNHLPHLPIEIITHIQSFLSLRDAARSAVLCSTLYRSWLAIDSFDFDPRLFISFQTFWDTSFEIIRRCKQRGVKLNRVTIRLSAGPRSKQMYHPIDEFVDSVVKLGACVLNFVMLDYYYLRLPDCVFTTNTVSELSVTDGVLCVTDDQPELCSSIIKMQLNPIAVLGRRRDIFKKFILRCPSIRQLECSGFFMHFKYNSNINLSPSLLSLTVDYLAYQDPFFYTHTIGLFPNLKSVKLGKIFSRRSVRINSRSVETLCLYEHYSAAPVVVNCPRMIRFEFEGSVHTRLNFEDPLQWTFSKIKVVHVGARGPLCEERCSFKDWNGEKKNWFSRLQRLLQSVARSRIHVSVVFRTLKPYRQYDLSEIGDPIPVDVLEVQTDSDARLVQNVSRVCFPNVLNYV